MNFKWPRSIITHQTTDYSIHNLKQVMTLVQPKELSELFSATFHNKYSFDDFLNLKVEDEIKIIQPKNTKNKEIVQASKKLKDYQRFINHIFLAFTKINENVVYSYRQGISYIDAVKKHANSQYFFQTDITNFFPSINIDDVRKVFEKNIDNPLVANYEQYIEHLVDLTTFNNALAIGFSTSPNITNTLLFDFDSELEKYCIENNLIYTRYSDDIIISSQNDEFLSGIQTTIVSLLKKYFDNRIKINPSKTKRHKKGQKVKLLGIVISESGTVTIDKNSKKQIEALIHFYLNDKSKFDDYLAKTFDGKISRLSGFIHYIETIDSEYLDKLRMKYGNYVIDVFANQSLRN